MTDPGIFNQLLIWPFMNILIAIYKFLEIAHIPGAFGWAIVVLTVIVRGAMSPLTKKQMESAKKLQAIKPHMDELHKKHKDDKKKLQEEQMKLYQQHGINPAAGCLPLLISFPILIGLYRVFVDVLSTGSTEEAIRQINEVVYWPFLQIQQLDLWFFGINLASKPSQWQTDGWWLLAIPVITGVLQYFQMKSTPGMGAPAPAVVDTKKSKKKQEEKKEGMEDMAASMQKQMVLIFPFMIAFFSYTFPVGLALYWNTFSLMTIWTQRKAQETAIQTTKK